MIVASYSFLSNEANCPRKAYHLYVARDLPKQPESKEQAYGNFVHKAFERRINEGTPLPEKEWEKYVSPILRMREQGCQVVAELQLALDKNERPAGDYWDKSNLIRGKLDVAVVHGPDAIIFDWKTGKVREDPFELEVQAWLLKKSRPELESIAGHYVWLAEKKLGAKHALSDTERTAASVRGQLAEAERRLVWPARPNPLCAFCPVKSCEHNRT